MSKVVRFSLRYEGREYEIAGQQFRVGREDDCDLVLKDGLVSRYHLQVVVTDEGLVLEDLKSRNGVFLNQRRIVEPTLLAHGDTISVGRETLEVMDVRVVPRRKRATMPAPYEESDVAGPEPVTTTTQLDVLSDREREVFELIVLGHTQREIATKLFLSVKTVETHRAHIAEKLKCKTRAELVAYAISSGMLRLGA
jgi:DNA-binding CsgD family transcriptional regulator